MPTTPLGPSSYCEVTKSPRHKLKIKLKLTDSVFPVVTTSDVFTVDTPDLTLANGMPNSASHQQPATGPEQLGVMPVVREVSTGSQPQHPSLHSFKNAPGAHMDATSLKVLQVAELVNWISSSGVSMPKLKHKDGTFYMLGQQAYI